MPVRDDDLTRALRDVAPAVDASGAYEQVVGKRARRRAARRGRVGALAVAVVVVVSAGVLLTRDEQSARVTTPAATSTTRATPLPEGWTRVKLTTDEGYLRGPLTVSNRGSDTLVSVAAYDRDAKGTFNFPPSSIVRYDPRTLEVIDRVDLQAEIVDVVDGPDGVRFALTRNPDPVGPVTAGMFIKRIEPDGSVTSNPLPPDTAARGLTWQSGTGYLWIGPSGFLRFTVDGTLDGASGQIDAVVFNTPPGFAPAPGVEQVPATRRAGDRTWITGSSAGAPALALVDPTTTTASRVVRLPGGRDVSFAWVADDTLLASSGGELLRHRVG